MKTRSRVYFYYLHLRICGITVHVNSIKRYFLPEFSCFPLVHTNKSWLKKSIFQKGSKWTDTHRKKNMITENKKLFVTNEELCAVICVVSLIHPADEKCGLNHHCHKCQSVKTPQIAFTPVWPKKRQRLPCDGQHHFTLPHWWSVTQTKRGMGWVSQGSEDNKIRASVCPEWGQYLMV